MLMEGPVKKLDFTCQRGRATTGKVRFQQHRRDGNPIWIIEIVTWFEVGTKADSINDAEELLE